MLGLMGEKLGMTQVYDQDGNAHPVTVVRAGPCTIIQVKTADRDGYNAIQVGFGTAKASRVTKPCRGHFEKHGVGLFRDVCEFRTDRASAYHVGQVINAAAFRAGDEIDVQGVSKGRGFQGVMKRHGARGGPASHGSTSHRRKGSIGMRARPGRVFKNMKLPGHMGDTVVTTRNLRVVEVRVDDNLIFVHGALPGSTGGLVTLVNRAPDFEDRDAFKAAKVVSESAETTTSSVQSEADATTNAVQEQKE